jgi:hypothetical protein
MAAFIAMTSWRGEFTDEYFVQPPADPVAFGMPAEDDGSREDPLLSDRSWAVSSYRPDLDALTAAPTRVVIAVGEESEGTFTGRSAVPPPSWSVSRRPCSRATTAASLAASSDTPANPKPSGANCATSSTITDRRTLRESEAGADDQLTRADAPSVRPDGTHHGRRVIRRGS